MSTAELLRRVPLLQRLRPVQLSALGMLATTVTFKSGEVVVREGQMGRRLYVVVSGLLSAAPQESNPPSDLLLGEGDYINELGVLDARSYTRSVVAVQPSTCLVLEGKDVEKEMAHDPELTVALLREMTRRGQPTDPATRPHADRAAALSPDSGDATDLLRQQMLVYADELNRVYHEEKQQVIQLRESIMGMVRVLAQLAESKDPHLAGHGARVGRHAQSLARKAGWEEPAVISAGLGGLLHDIGNLVIDSALLAKGDQLTPSERRVMQGHVEAGVRIVSAIPSLLPIVPYIRDHHEWLNGRGYPRGLRGEEISPEGRLLAVVDCYDAMLHARSYREQRVHREALTELRRYAGRQFDPQYLLPFLELAESGGLENPQP
ncbi:MAG: HD domain-containing protein [Chloroflexi bacterium]|nr:HD domain-containing protein [Chloroflexota bacterium]